MGMVGIADGQTARLNIVNLATVDPTTGALAPPCRARLQFVDADGTVLPAVPRDRRAVRQRDRPDVDSLRAAVPCRVQIRSVKLGSLKSER
jgi:hypothetical protein